MQLAQCDSCGVQFHGRPHVSSREVETGRSGASFTLGGSQSRSLWASGRSSTRKGSGFSINGGRTYYKKIRYIECDPCYRSRRRSERRMMGLVVIVALVIAGGIFLISRKPSDLKTNATPISAPTSVPNLEPRSVLNRSAEPDRRNPSSQSTEECDRIRASRDWSDIVRRVDNGNSTPDDDRLFNRCNTGP